MDKDQGLQVIEQALQIANSKGAFKLEEAATIFAALTTVKNAVQEPEVKEAKEPINTKTK
jgi:hypothetical protein